MPVPQENDRIQDHFLYTLAYSISQTKLTLKNSNLALPQAIVPQGLTAFEYSSKSHIRKTLFGEVLLDKRQSIIII